jgi:hypothetical protein
MPSIVKMPVQRQDVHMWHVPGADEEWYMFIWVEGRNHIQVDRHWIDRSTVWTNVAGCELSRINLAHDAHYDQGSVFALVKRYVREALSLEVEE